MAVPPTRSELGYASTPGGGRTRVAVGAQLASGLPATATRIEAGVGLLYESSATDDSFVRHDPERGVYADLGIAALRVDHARILVGGRGERHYGSDTPYVAKLRVDLEAFAYGKGTLWSEETCAADNGWIGQRAFGVYGEAGRAFDSANMTDDWMASVGITVRLPALYQVGICGGSTRSSSRSTPGRSGGRWIPSS